MRGLDSLRRSCCRRPLPRQVVLVEILELRSLLSAAADVTQLTALRADPNYAGVDGSGVGVAVIDTGLFAAHPDLRDNFVAYFDAVTTPASNPGSTDLAAAFDPDGHGTHVAGTVGATNPEVGVAPAADLVGVRGLPSPGDPRPQFDTVANSLQWVLANHQRFNIKVVNMSLGDYTTNFNTVPGGTRPAVFDELEQAGVVTVIASGNNYANFITPGSSVPGIFGTLTVANTWPDGGANESFPHLGASGQVDFVAAETDAAPDRFAATSQRSTLPNQVAAPGSGILSTWNDPNKLYNTLSGTSMASPFVAGMIALMQDAAFTFGGRYLSAGEVQTIVRDSADTIVDSAVASNFRIPIGWDAEGRPFRAGPDQDLPETGLTFRRVNAYRAVQQVRAAVTGTTPDPDPNPTPDPGDQGDTNNTTTSAVVVPALDATADYVFRGRIGTDGSVNTGADDVDLFRVTLQTPGNLIVSTGPAEGGQAFDPFLRVFDGAGTEITTADNVGDNRYPTLQTGRLPAGTYYVGVSSVANVAYNPTTGGGTAAGQTTGDYTAVVGLSNADPNGVAQGAANVDLTSPDALSPDTGLPANFFPGSIGSDPNPVDPGRPRVQIGDTDVDMFRLVAPDDGTLTIDVDARDSGTLTDGVDSYVRVFSGNLTQIAFNDDTPGVGTDSFLEVPVAAGQAYYVAVTTFGNRDFNPADPFDRVSATPGAVGSYDLFLSFDNGDADGTVFQATPSIPGIEEEGTIGADDGLPVGAGGAKDVDFYELAADEGDAGGLLDVQAASPDGTLAPVLALWQYDPAQNDVVKVFDTAGKDARIIVPVVPGRSFFVSVTGFGNNDFNWAARASGSGGDTGNYTLTSRLRPGSELAALTDDSIQGATPSAVAPGDRLMRTIGVDGGVTVGADDVDLYRLTPSIAGTLTVRALVPGEATTDPVLRLFDAAGNELAFNDDAAAGTRDGVLSVSVNAGQEYFIGVNGSSAAARAYNPVSGAGAAPGDGGDYVLEVSGITPGEVTIPFGGRQRATYTDASGDAVIVSLKGPGSGVVRFPTGSAGNVDAVGIVVDGATAATSLLIRAAGAGTPTGDVNVNGSLRALTGKTADLTGNLTATGSVAKVALRSAGGGKTVTLGAGAPASLAFASVSDLSVNSLALIKSIKATQWLDADATPDQVTAPIVGSITVRGEFGAGVTAGTLLRAKVGSLNGSDVRAADAIGTLTAGSASGSRIFAGVAPGFTTLPDSADDFVNPAAVIRAVSVKGAFGNTLVAAPTVGKASLGVVSSVGNGGTPFGVAANTVRSLSARTPSGTLRRSRLDDPVVGSVREQDFAVVLF